LHGFYCHQFSVGPTQTGYYFQPNKQIQVTCVTDASGVPSYTVQYKSSAVIETSRLGIARQDADFSKNLTTINASPVTAVKENYQLVTGKRRSNTYTANKQIVHYKNRVRQHAIAYQLRQTKKGGRLVIV